MYAFEATYDEEGAAQAERAFYVRSVLELRCMFTFAPPVLFALVVAVALALEAPPWFIAVFSAAFVLSIAVPVFFYYARSLAAKRLAHKYPIRQVSLTPNAFEITAGGQKSVVAWDRIKHVWNTGDYILLVLGRFVSVSIPRRSLPQGAHEFIQTSVKKG